MTARTIPEWKRLSLDQRAGRSCVDCEGRLYTSVHVGVIINEYGREVDLYAHPECATPDEITAQANIVTGPCVICGRHSGRAVIIGVEDGRSVAEYAHAHCRDTHRAEQARRVLL